MSEDGRYTEDPILPPLAPPPPDLIQIRGARLVLIHDADPPKPKGDGGRQGIILGWAPVPDGGWAILLAWTSYYRLTTGHATDKARCGWYRLESRVKPIVPPPLGLKDQRWHGHLAGSQLDLAVDAAVRLLPEELREAALTPAEQQGS